MTPPDEPAEGEFELSSEAAEKMGTQLASALAPSHASSETIEIPEHDTWPYEIDGAKGTAWVFLADGHDDLTDPLIVSDGFQGVPSSLEEWSVLWSEDPDDPEGYPWAKDVSDAGKDLILLGYNDRTASILDNAKIAKACILEAIEKRVGDTPLVVGGFSMGGLITRYTLALMEYEEEHDGGPDHQTSTYFSYDSPHRGGWIPISVQAFAHFIAGLKPNEPKMTAMSRMLNSPAARQMATYHISTHKNDPQAAPDDLRDTFSDALQRVGSFPQKPKRIAVANGRADGVIRDLPTDNITLLWSGKPGATLYGQTPGTGQVVAQLRGLLPNFTVKTDDIPALDGAPGGTLETNGIAVNALTNEGITASTAFPWVCFVPTVSAVDVADPESSATSPIPPSPPAGCGFHTYKCATASDEPADLEHTRLTRELCTWLLENFE
ncbi:MAG TPA: hypothetical protein VF526_03030 [Solirubrobacteraceae bacterium]